MTSETVCWLPPSHTINCIHNSDHDSGAGGEHTGLTLPTTPDSLLWGEGVTYSWLYFNILSLVLDISRMVPVCTSQDSHLPQWQWGDPSVMLPHLWGKVLWRGPVVDVTNGGANLNIFSFHGPSSGALLSLSNFGWNHIYFWGHLWVLVVCGQPRGK